MISWVAFIGSLELGFAYALMALGLFISFRILDIADLTVDSSFTTGAAVCAIVTVSGHPFLALFASMVAGALAGGITAFLHTKMNIQAILAGILSMTGLYSINLRIMGGKPNISLSKVDTVFTLGDNIFGTKYSSLIITFIIAAIIGILIIFFLGTRLGRSVRATGDNEIMVRSSSINSNMTKTVGICLANMLVALSGAVICQTQKFVDIKMGIGVVVIGLASIITGEVIFGKRSIKRHVIAVILGSVIYRIIIAFVLNFGIDQSDLKLLSAVIVGVAISYPTIKRSMKGGRRNA